MKPWIIIIFLVCYSLMVQAQFNDTTHYHIILTAAGSINKTDDTKAYLLNNSLNFSIKKKDVVLNATNTWIYGKQNNQLTNNDFSSALFVNLYKTFPHFYYSGLLNYNTSYSLKINNQLLAGAGVAYSIIDKKNIYLNLSDGVLFDQSDLLVNEIYHTYRSSFRLQYHFSLNDLIVLDGSNFLQNSFNNRNDYIIRSTTTLSLN